MKRNKLGLTGLEVTPLTIGAWQLGGPLFFDGKPDGHPDPGKENVIRMIQELGDLGVNAIDTAEQYSAGESERRVGQAIAGKRDQWVLSTKFGYRVGPNNTRVDDSSPATILPSLEGSLTRLGCDVIDLFLYHCAPDPAQLDEGLAILNRAKEQGKIRAFGISTNDYPLLEKMVRAGSVEVVQFATNLLQPQDDIWQLCRSNSLGAQLRGVMAQGRLSGKYFNTPPAFRPDDNRSRGVRRRRLHPLRRVGPGPTAWRHHGAGCHPLDPRSARRPHDLPGRQEPGRLPRGHRRGRDALAG